MLKKLKRGYLRSKISFLLVFLWVFLCQSLRSLVKWRCNDKHMESYDRIRDFIPTALLNTANKETLRFASIVADIFSNTFGVYGSGILHVRWLDKYNNIHSASVAAYHYLSEKGIRFGTYMSTLHYRNQLSIKEIAKAVVNAKGGYQLLAYTFASPSGKMRKYEVLR